MKKLLIVLTIAVVATGAIATRLWLDLRSERARAAEIATRTAAAELMQRTPAAAPPPAASVQPEVATVAAQPVAPVPVAAPTAQQASKGAQASPVRDMLEAMASPEGQDSMRKMMSAAMEQMYPDIEREIGLTRQEREKLFDLLSSEGMESATLMLGGGQSPAETRALQRKMVEAEQIREASVATLLGSRYPKWDEYQSTEQARQEVQQLGRVLLATGNPLSDVQSKALVDAFASEQRRAHKQTREWSRSEAAINSPDMMQEMMDREVDNQKRLVDVAAPILAPAQLERYKRQAEQEAAMMRATMGLMTGGGKP